MLTADGIGHRFGNRTLFRNVSIQVRPGEVVFIVGPSGTGKSTLLFILGGLIEHTAGAIKGRPDSIGWVLQDLSGLAQRSVLDNAQVYAAIDEGRSKATRTRARDAVAAVGLAYLSGTRAGALSGGENQRLCVARALASNRPLILADEPTSQLDRENARRVMPY